MKKLLTLLLSLFMAFACLNINSDVKADNNDYLTFTFGTDGGTISLSWVTNNYNYIGTGEGVQYKINDGSWTSYTNNSSITVPANGVIQWQATKYINGVQSGGGNIGFKITGSCAASGDIQSLNNFSSSTEGSFAYYNLFKNCTTLTSAPKLSATSLTLGCYEGMFEGCTSLTEAPELPATTLADQCYQQMFKGCTSLTSAPSILPATTLTSSCYRQMFFDCTSLEDTPELCGTTFASYCYEQMFYYSNDKTPSIKAVSAEYINDSTYNNSGRCVKEFKATISSGTTPTNAFNQMFYGATIEANNTYYISVPESEILTFSFSEGGSINLKHGSTVSNLYYRTYSNSNDTWSNWTAINLNNGISIATNDKIQYRATSYVHGSDDSVGFEISGKCIATGSIQSLNNFSTKTSECCYKNLFKDCEGLLLAPELPATTLSKYCYCGMFSGATNVTLIPDLPATVLPEHCYEFMFYDSGVMLVTASYKTQTPSNFKEYNKKFIINATSVSTNALLSMFNKSKTTYVGTPSKGTLYYVKDAITPTANNLTYNATPQTLVTAGSTLKGTIVYSLDNVSYSTALPTGTNAGTYNVYFKLEGESEARDYCIAVTIAKKDISATINSATRLYNGEALTCAEGENNGLISGHNITYNSDSSIKFPGSIVNVLNSVTITDSESNDVTSNYNVTSLTNGTLEVTINANVNRSSASQSSKIVTAHTLDQTTSVDTSSLSLDDTIKTNIEGSTVTNTRLAVKTDGTSTAYDSVVTGAYTAESSAVASLIDSASDVNVKLTVTLTPRDLVTTTNNQSITYNLTPSATVSVGDASESNISVTPSMLDTSEKVNVKLYTGFEPAQLIHKSNDGVVIETLNTGEFTYDSTTGYVTFAISHFSDVVVNESSAVAGYNSNGEFVYYSDLQTALNNAGDNVVYLLKDFNASNSIISVRDSQTLDLNGHSITNAYSLYINGIIKDTGVSKGYVSTSNLILTNTSQTSAPIYDNTVSGYRFIELKISNYSKIDTDNALLFWVARTTNRAYAYSLFTVSDSYDYTNNFKASIEVNYTYTDEASSGSATDTYKKATFTYTSTSMKQVVSSYSESTTTEYVFRSKIVGLSGYATMQPKIEVYANGHGDNAFPIYVIYGPIYETNNGGQSWSLKTTE